MILFVLIVNKKIDVSQCLSNAKIWNYIYITKHFVIFLLNNELYHAFMPINILGFCNIRTVWQCHHIGIRSVSK